MRHTTPIVLFAVLVFAALVAGISANALAHQPATIAARPDALRSPWPPLRTAGPFLLAHIDDEAAGRWGKAWTSLYPMHRRIVARDTYVRCETATPFVLPLAVVFVRHVQRVDVVVAGLARPILGVAVTVRAVFASYGPRDAVSLTQTFHLVPVHGSWKWLLSRSRFQLYLHNRCGSGPPA
jgi:hypothetical protein